MPTKERDQQMRVVAEILLIHLPEVLSKDQPLAHDLLAVVGTALNTIYEDAERSTEAWDKRAYHSRADAMRKEWVWALAASNYATGLALRSDPLTPAVLEKVQRLIQPGMQRPSRRQITDPTRFRGAARAVQQQQAQKRKPVRG